MDKNITNSPTSGTAGKATVYSFKDDETKVLEELKEVQNGDSELDKDDLIFDSGINHDDFGKMDAGMNPKFISQGVTMSNDIEQVGQCKEMDEEQIFKSKVEEEKTKTTRDNCADGIEHDVLVNVNPSMVLNSKSQLGLLSSDIEQLNLLEKMDEEHNIKSKVEEEKTQTTKENCSDSIEHDLLGEVWSTDLDSKSQQGLLRNNFEHVEQDQKMDEGQNFKSKGIEETEQTSRENCGDSIQDDLSNLSMDLESKSQHGLLSNDIEQVEQGEKMDVEQNFKSKIVEETTKTNRENCGDSTKHGVFGELNSCPDLEYKSRLGAVNIEQVEKMDSGTNLESNEKEQTTGDSCADNVKSDDLGVVDRVGGSLCNDIGLFDQVGRIDEGKNVESKPEEVTKKISKENCGEESIPILVGTKVPVTETKRCISFSSLKVDIGTEEPVRREKVKSIRDIVRSKSVVAVTSFLRAVSGKFTSEEEKNALDSTNDKEVKKVFPKGDKSAWNPLSFIIRYNDVGNKSQQGEDVCAEAPQPIITKGRIILYTKLGCQSCNEVRLFLYNRRLRYVEINIDVYPGRKQELEKYTGSCVVPKVFFNEVVIGGLSELKSLDESGILEEKIDYLITEEPAYEAPLPPLSGEDDTSSLGPIDELALIVRKMKESIVVKDRFYKMRRFSSCFVGSDAVNFLSEDQLLEKEEAVEFGRKLASKLFFQHVLQENLFEDGNHLYWFLDDNPTVSSQCRNIPRGISEVKPRPLRDIASRLRFLSRAIYEAYLSEDGKHVDYRTIHGSEEFARYLRIIQELQRAEFQNIPREEKLAFFINLYNMMTIHAILVLGHPNGPTERRKLLGDFKYVMGGCSYSLSDIQNGILRCNKRLPFTLTKPFGVNDKRAKICLPYPEPLIHFALVLGTRSGPPLRCYSPGNIDQELMDAARNFLRSGGLIVEYDAKVARPSKLLKWFSVDFGETELEVLKHASNYLDPAKSEALLELLSNGELKVMYQHYDWGLNL